MDSDKATVEFTLRPAGLAPVQVHLRRAGTRWFARVAGVSVTLAVGATARQALTVAFEPLGEGAVGGLLTDLGLLGPSIAVMEIEAAAQTG